MGFRRCRLPTPAGEERRTTVPAASRIARISPTAARSSVSTEPARVRRQPPPQRHDRPRPPYDDPGRGGPFTRHRPHRQWPSPRHPVDASSTSRRARGPWSESSSTHPSSPARRSRPTSPTKGASTAESAFCATSWGCGSCGNACGRWPARVMRPTWMSSCARPRTCPPSSH